MLFSSHTNHKPTGFSGFRLLSSLCLAWCSTAGAGQINAVKRLSISARRLHYDGTYLYVGGSSAVRIYSLDAPASPQLAGSFSVSDPVLALGKVGTHLLVGLDSTESDNLHVEDVADPASTSTLFRGRIGDGGHPVRALFGLDTAFLAGVSQSLLPLNMIEPTDPLEENELVPDAAGSELALGARVERIKAVVDEDRAYIATLAAVKVVDIADLDTMQVIASRTTPGEINWGLAIDGGTLIAGEGFAGVRVYDPTDPQLQVQRTYTPSDFNEVWAVALQDFLAYAATASSQRVGANGGLRVWNLNDASDADARAWSYEVANGLDVLAVGDYAYLAESSALGVYYYPVVPEILELVQGWNNISLSRVPADTSVGAVLGSAVIGAAQVLGQRSYSSSTELQPLRGQWVYCPSGAGAQVNLSMLDYPADADTDGDGVPDAQDSDPNGYVITLRQGWNNISLASLPEDNSVQTILGTRPTGTVWVWDGTRYLPTDQLLSLRGHLVYSDDLNDVEIQIQLSR